LNPGPPSKVGLLSQNLATLHFIEENRKTYKDVEKLEFIPPRDLAKSSYKQAINHI
jgi:hypothetical protein